VQGGLLSESELEKVRKTVAAEIEEAIEFGVNSAYPDAEKELEYYEKVLKV
jgi:TPP-dependent pyruvate/acetoin dehydrogenase alpha subunit